MVIHNQVLDGLGASRTLCCQIRHRERITQRFRPKHAQFGWLRSVGIQPYIFGYSKTAWIIEAKGVSIIKVNDDVIVLSSLTVLRLNSKRTRHPKVKKKPLALAKINNNVFGTATNFFNGGSRNFLAGRKVDSMSKLQPRGAYRNDPSSNNMRAKGIDHGLNFR